MADEDTAQVLSDLRRAQAVFQLRALSAVLGVPSWSPESHLGALPDRPAPTTGKIIPGKSRRIKRKK